MANRAKKITKNDLTPTEIYSHSATKERLLSKTHMKPELLNKMDPNTRSDCPLSCVLELIGDKWTLLLIRDVLMGKHRYGDFEKSPEQIPTNILAERLKRLVREKIMTKVCYQQRPPRYAYTLTEKGADLVEILKPLIKWGLKHNTGTWQPPENFWQLDTSGILERQQKNIDALVSEKGLKE